MAIEQDSMFLVQAQFRNPYFPCCCEFLANSVENLAFL